MTPIEAIRDALKQGGKVRGYRKPIYKAGVLAGYAQQYIELLHSDVLEVAMLAQAAAPDDEIAKAKVIGSKEGAKEPGRRCTILADDAFHILDLACPEKPSKQPAPEKPSKQPAPAAPKKE